VGLSNKDRIWGGSLLKQLPLCQDRGGSPENTNMNKEPAVDAPPLDDSDSDGVPARGDIQPIRFKKSTATGSPRPNADRQQTTKTKSPAGPSTRNSRRRADGVAQISENTVKKETSGKAVKAEDDELGAHFRHDVDSIVTQTTKRKLSTFEKRFSTRRLQAPDSPGSGKRFMVPTKFSSQQECESPTRQLKVPTGGNASTLDTSPVRKFKRPRAGKEIPVERARPEPEASPEPVLKIPEIFSPSFDFDAGDSTLLDVDGISRPTLTRRSTSPLTEATTPSSSMPVCPMCYETVEKELLDEFKATHPRMTLQQEQQFCLLHKRTSARNAWVANGYPDIKWGRLEARINRQHDFLKAILEGGKSHFSEMFSQKVKTGQNKTLLKSDESLTPGYYGIRGLRTMSENLVSEFSSLLRKRAVKDRLVSARGHTAYVQSVLIPELAVRLIMEDMDVNEDEARSIMADSRWIGEILNEEVADVVLSEDDESGSGLSSYRDFDAP